MAQAEHEEVLSVPRDKLFATITRYEDYPRFVDGCSTVQVERKGSGQARVRYSISVLGKEGTYVLDHREDAAAGTVEWTLVESNLFKKNTGRWQLSDAGAGKTKAKYTLEMEFTFPVPGFILSGLVKKSLPTMVRSFATQAGKG